MPIVDQFGDCSSNNPVPDLVAYKAAGHRYLCRKVTEGTGYHWLDGDDVARRAHGLALHVGHYHWLREDQDALEQAKVFVDTVKTHLGKPPTVDVTKYRPDGDWFMTDYEQTFDSNGQPVRIRSRKRAAQLRIFNGYVRAQLPDYPLFTYTGNWYVAQWFLVRRALRKFGGLVVMSDYSHNPPLNPYNYSYAAHQFTDRATVAGFGEPVDYNLWLLPEAPPVPVPVPTAKRHPRWAIEHIFRPTIARLRARIAQLRRHK